MRSTVLVCRAITGKG